MIEYALNLQLNIIIQVSKQYIYIYIKKLLCNVIFKNYSTKNTILKTFNADFRSAAGRFS